MSNFQKAEALADRLREMAGPINLAEAGKIFATLAVAEAIDRVAPQPAKPDAENPDDRRFYGGGG